jgi:predicted MPP superfamily phosphohydrolase
VRVFKVISGLNFRLSYDHSFSMLLAQGLPMARYTSLFTIAVSLDSLQRMLSDLLESCNLDIIYDTGDYLMAREVPGQVSFAKLVTVEVLIDRFPEKEEEVRMNFVVKNEELPLKTDNHCRQMFNQVNRAIVENHQWHLIESAAS